MCKKEVFKNFNELFFSIIFGYGLHFLYFCSVKHGKYKKYPQACMQKVAS